MPIGNYLLRKIFGTRENEVRKEICELLAYYAAYFLNEVSGPTDCPETWVRNYHYTLHKIPEVRRSHLLRGGSLKSLK